MTLNTANILSVTEVNQNFSKAIHMAESKGPLLIFKRNKPRYMLIDLESLSSPDMNDDEKIDIVAKRILEQYKPAFMELSK